MRPFLGRDLLLLGHYRGTETERVRLEARSFSAAILQPALTLLLCFVMHASVAEMLGIVELQRRQASPIHARPVSAFQAKLGVERIEKETAKAAMSKALQMVRLRSVVIVKTPCQAASAARVDALTMPQPAPNYCD